jgi:hypothetical protein
MLLIGSEASARNEQLQWTHTNPSTVDSFTVHWRTSTSSTTDVNAGKPSQSGNTFTFTIPNMPDTGDVYFRVSARNAGGPSPQSNEICRGPGVPCGTVTPPPPPPPPPPGGTTPQASISSFKLWNATTDTVITSSFQSGGTITASCAAIEILGNTYLANGGGSIRKDFGGQSICENAPPYGWQDGATPGQFDCAAFTNGNHSLMVTPYDGENCSGTQGTSVELDFTVNVPTAPPPPQAVGQPGKPYLVQ